MSPRLRRREHSKPAGVADILDKVFERRKLKGRIKENRVFGVWDKAVGKAIAEHASPVFVRDGILTIEAKNNTWLTELSFFQEDMIRELNAALGAGAIRELRFRVAKRGSLKKGRGVQLNTPIALPKKLDNFTEAEIDRHIANIEDVELREALRGFMRRGAARNTDRKAGGKD